MKNIIIPYKSTLSVIAFFWVLACSPIREAHAPAQHSETTPPPAAKILPGTDTIHGNILIDNYHWLRDRSDPDVIAYLNAENNYTRVVMEPTEKLQEKLYHEMIARIKETDLTVPEKIGNYYYYSRTEEKKQYPIYCRKKGNLDAREETILDVNQLAEDHEYFDVTSLRVSPDHNFLAFLVDTLGEERFILHVKDLTTGETLEDRITNTGYSFAWAVDNSTIFYTTLDDTKRSYKLYRHALGTDVTEDPLVFHEENGAFFISVSLSKSRRYLFMQLDSHATTEIHYLNADEPGAPFRLFQPRKENIEYYVDHHDEKFYIMTNDQAQNFKIMCVAAKDPDRENWEEFIPHRNEIVIENFDVFKDYLVIYERENGLEKINVVNINTQESYYIDFPEPAYTFWTGRNADFNSHLLRFTYTSLITPRSVFDYDMAARTCELKKEYEILGGYDRTHYVSERIFALAPDSTQVPISLVYRRGLKQDGSNPLYLEGYGAYGISSDAYFSTSRLSLLDRGFIYAIAHVRGGGEMGRSWYEQGKLLNKKNTFTDFISCAEHLISEQYTSSQKLVIYGGSAGGLLVGAVVNMRPNLFKIAIGDVPFVDLINTMLDPTLPLTMHEYDEWGDPGCKQYFDYMTSYSPYDNITGQEYPCMLIMAGLNDSRVMYWEAAKWVARLRATKTDSNLLVFRVNMGQGHLGASGRYEIFRDIAFEYAFVLMILGMH